jgi:outer membrane protein assembly factor BamA
VNDQTTPLPTEKSVLSGCGDRATPSRAAAPHRIARWILVAAACAPVSATVLAQQQTTRPTTTPAAVAPGPHVLPIAPELQGRRIEAVRIVGNVQVTPGVILNVVRTREGEPFEPTTVEEDIKRIFELRRFANVEAKVEPTETGVVVVFSVTEQKQIKMISFRGNKAIDTKTLQDTIDLTPGQAIDRFRIAIARQAIEGLYRDKNYPHAHVDVPPEPLAERGELLFDIREGPEVRVRKVDFKGRHSFTKGRLLDQIKTRSWIWIFRPGTYDPEQIDDDVASLRKYYMEKGFFDVRVGRKIIVSPDQTEVQVDFLIEEGVRYRVDKVLFKGNANVPEADLRKDLNLVEGQFYDNEVVQRDIRQMVRAYSPFGFVYQENSDNPDYLRIKPQQVFHKEAGTVDLVYDISEGKPFRLGRVIVKGNTKSMDKLVLREMRVKSGELYNSGEIQDGIDRLKERPYFTKVQATPIGDSPDTRDVLVEVTEGRTAQFNIGAGVNSNGGVGGQIAYTQRNFDVTNWPTTWTDVFSDRAFTGAGQTFRVAFEPGTEFSNADIFFAEPYLFDQNYSFSNDAYWRTRVREHYDEIRIGDRVTFGKRFSDVYSGTVSFRGEDVNIRSIEDRIDRAQEILDWKGHSTLTSVGFQLRRNTTKGGFVPYEGSDTTAGVEQGGALGGEVNFTKLTAGWNYYQTLGEDLLDRKTILNYRVDAGWIPNDAPFFERFYGGGIGSLRGFRYRGVSPRAGRFDDPVGGDFSVVGTVELSFPLVGDTFRGVVFSDVGDVERNFEVGTIRSSVGTGIRLFLPILGQAPIALDFAYPITKDSQDQVRIISFSFGFMP